MKLLSPNMKSSVTNSRGFFCLPVTEYYFERIFPCREGKFHCNRFLNWFNLFQESFEYLKRSALLITETELKLIAAAAMIGLKRIPKKG